MRVPDYGKGFEQAVLQEHTGDNGKPFDAWSLSGTADPIKSILQARKQKYNGILLGEPKKLELVAK